MKKFALLISCAAWGYGQTLTAQMATFEFDNRSNNPVYIRIAPESELTPLTSTKLTNFQMVGPKQAIVKGVDTSRKTMLLIAVKQNPSFQDLLGIYEFAPMRNIYIYLRTDGSYIAPQRGTKTAKGLSIRNNVKNEHIARIELSSLAPEILPPDQYIETILQSLNVASLPDAIAKIDELKAAVNVCKREEPSEQALILGLQKRSQDLDRLLQTIEVTSIEAALNKIEQLDFLLELTNANTAKEAITQLSNRIATIANRVKIIYQQIAQTTGSTELQNALVAIPAAEPESIFDIATMKELNQQAFDAIYDLKQQLFEVTHFAETFAKPLIEQLQEIISANTRGEPCDAIKILIPSAIPEYKGPKPEEIQQALKALSAP